MSTKDLAEPLVASEPKVPDTEQISGWPLPIWLMILIVIIVLTLGWFFFLRKPESEDMVNDEGQVGEETDESDDEGDAI